MAQQKQQAQSQGSGGPREKILRIGIILGGKIVEERLIRTRETVTIGQSAKNTFSIPAPELPKTWPLFSAQQGKYSLHFAEGMDGRISDGGAVQALAQLKTGGQAQRVGDRWVLQMSDAARGKVILGDMTILFQFVIAPPLQPRPQLPQSVRGRLLDRIDPYMAVVLLFSLIAHSTAIAWIYSSDTPRKPEPDEIPDRFAKALLEKPPEPKPVEVAVGQTKEPAKEAAKEDKGGEKAEKPPAKAPPKEEPAGGGGDDEAKAKEEAEARGLIATIGSKGKGQGRFSDVTDGKNPGGDLQAGIDKARKDGTGVATNGGTGGGTRGSATGTVGGGSGPGVAGPKGTGDGKGVKVGEAEIKATGNVGKPVVDDDGGLDAESVYQKIKSSYYGAVQKCYQDALKANSSLKGRVDVTITIGPAGNVTSVEVDGFDSGVDACIQANARRWRFNKPPNGSATFQFPFTFRPAS